MDIYEIIQQNRKQGELTQILTCNEATERFGLSLTQKDAEELTICRNASLKKYQRVEFGAGILDKLIFYFCDSQYIDQNNYLETLKQLQEIFYQFKNKTNDKLSDEELLNFMREQFDKICFGDLEYLESTCLERYAQAIRSGYNGYQSSEGKGDYEQFSEEMRWDKDLYMEVVKDLFWR